MKIAQDKIGHLRAGAAIALIISIAGYMIFGITDMKYAIFASLVAGAGKEAYDYFDNMRRAKKGLKAQHTVEFADFWFTLVGGLAVVLFMTFII